jgi:hypothetical protein
LEEHGDGSDNDPLEHSFGLEERSNGNELELENVPFSLLAKMREGFGNTALLEKGLCLDFEEFQFDKLMVNGEVTKRGEVRPGFFFASVVYKPAWGEGHPYHSDEKDESWDKLKADGYEPCGVGLRLECGASDVVGSVVDPEADHDTECNGELLQCYKSATDLTVSSQHFAQEKEDAVSGGTYGGAHSLLYMGTMTERPPTPIPL